MSNTTRLHDRRKWRLAARSAATRTNRVELRVRFQTGWIVSVSRAKKVILERIGSVNN